MHGSKGICSRAAKMKLRTRGRGNPVWSSKPFANKLTIHILCRQAAHLERRRPLPSGLAPRYQGQLVHSSSSRNATSRQLRAVGARRRPALPFRRCGRNCSRNAQATS